MMRDQAERLRILAEQMRPEGQAASALRSSQMRCIVVVSGKGGVGKTNFSANLALLLSKAGKRVILIDADWGLANVELVLGIDRPEFTIQHFVLGEKELPEIIVPAPDGLLFIANGSGMKELANLEVSQREHLLTALANLEKVADTMIIDSGAGLSRNVLSFALAGQEIIVVTNPEPTAIRDAYATIKVICLDNPDCRISVVVNRVVDATEGLTVYKRIANSAKVFLQKDIEYLGHIVEDKNVQKAVSRRKPFILAYPYSPAAKCLGDIATKLGVAPPVRTMAVRDLFKMVSGAIQGR